MLSRLAVPHPETGTISNPVDRCHAVSDLRALARRRLPRAVFDFIDGAAEDEVSLRNSSAGFGHYDLVPRMLAGLESVDTGTEVMGRKIDLPLIISPTGIVKLFRREGEGALAAAARRAGSIYTLSTGAATSIEDAAAAAGPAGAMWFQIYVWRDRSLTGEYIRRCREAGYKALCLTVDVPVLGKRERDFRNHFGLPLKISPQLVFDVLSHPAWFWRDYLTAPRITLPNIEGSNVDNDLTMMSKFIDSQFDPSVSWQDAAWMLEEWDGPFAVKGILCAEDARRAVDLGFSTIIVSNHGGRQLDQAPGPIDVLPEIVEAVDGRAEVILDGGVRRGTDILKAVALGAKACMTGRPFLYGLAAAGPAGADRVFEILGDEIRRNMTLVGVGNLAELGPQHLRQRK